MYTEWFNTRYTSSVKFEVLDVYIKPCSILISKAQPLSCVLCIYIYISFFFNAKVSLSYYFDSPNWLITISFLSLSRVLYVVYVSVENYVLCTMYTFEIKFVLFCLSWQVINTDISNWQLGDKLTMYVKREAWLLQIGLFLETLFDLIYFDFKKYSRKLKVHI